MSMRNLGFGYSGLLRRRNKESIFGSSCWCVLRNANFSEVWNQTTSRAYMASPVWNTVPKNPRGKGFHLPEECMPRGRLPPADLVKLFRDSEALYSLQRYR